VFICTRGNRLWESAARGVRTYKNHVDLSIDACISSQIKLEHVITCTFGCRNGEMRVDSFSDATALDNLALAATIYRSIVMQLTPSSVNNFNKQ
jgi:hypothetical protein